MVEPVYDRRVIRIKGSDSPNVRLALAQIAAGQAPSGEMIVPGVLSWEDYSQRLRTWDERRRSVGLEAMFWMGKESMLYPLAWLDRAERIARLLRPMKRTAKAMGIDTAEGGDDTAWSIVDELGLIYQQAIKTPDTGFIMPETIRLMELYGLPDQRVMFDRNGGGKQIADQMRGRGIYVRTVFFGEAPSLRIKHGRQQVKDRRQVKEVRAIYKNMRAEMYGNLRDLLEPSSDTNKLGFALPQEYAELRRQLALIPYLKDGEDRMYMLPKSKRDPKSTELTLMQILGCSPDEADSLVIAIHCMLSKPERTLAGAVRL